MSITKRTLTKWRKEALLQIKKIPENEPVNMIFLQGEKTILADRILLMTQELLDQELLKEANKDEG